MKKGLLPSLLFLVALAALSFWQQRPYMDLFPAQHHSWTQSDRYAIALQFSSETLNPFQPRTYNLRPENYTGPEGEQVMNGVTAMDLPLVEYGVGLIMRLTGNRTPIVFRVCMWLLSVLGLFFLFRLPMLFGHGPLQGLVLVAVVYLSPVYHHYMVGFSPSVAALSLSMVGLYFMGLHIQVKGKGHFYIALLALGLAAFIRLPFAVLLIALLLTSIWCGSEGRKDLRISLWPTVVLLLGLLLYWGYNQYLSSEYGSMFIGNLLLPSSLGEAKHWIGQSLEHWGLDYLHWVGYAFLGVLLIGALLQVKNGLPKSQGSFLTWWWRIALAGYACFTLLMLGQFPNHDYYGLDAFFPPMLLVVLWAYHRAAPQVWNQWWLPVLALLGFGVAAYPHLQERQEQRYFIQAWDLNHVTYKNFEGAEAFLDAEGIAKDTRMLVIDAFTTNIPLIEMGRKGYTVLTTSQERMSEALQWPLDYVVLQDTFAIPEAVMNYNDIVNQLSFVCGNGRISVYRKKAPETESERLCRVLYHGKRSYDGDPVDSNWNGWQATQGQWVQSGTLGAHVIPEGEYSESLTLYPGRLKDSLALSTLVLTGYFKMDSICNEVSAVVSVVRGDSMVHYDRQYFVYRIHGKAGLERAVFHFPLPIDLREEDELKCYFWKEGDQNFYFDDLEAMLYQ